MPLHQTFALQAVHQPTHIILSQLGAVLHAGLTQHALGRALDLMADAYLFTISNWAAHTGVNLAPYPNVLAYRKRIGARPAVQAALAAEGLIKAA